MLHQPLLNALHMLSSHKVGSNLEAQAVTGNCRWQAWQNPIPESIKSWASKYATATFPALPSSFLQYVGGMTWDGMQARLLKYWMTKSGLSSAPTNSLPGNGWRYAPPRFDAWCKVSTLSEYLIYGESQPDIITSLEQMEGVWGECGILVN